ncbi:MAG: ABC transporter permease [Rhabdochlamydiaceae bacterium]|nr:ABC transporter permease [Candidatus Amphrikana amoebophyrae]
MELLKKRLKFLITTGEYIILILDVIVACIKRPPPWSSIREQLYEIGVLSLPVVAMTGFSTGLVLAAQSFYQLSDKGLAGATGIMVGKAMITELGPVLTAFMVTGRVGAAMCAELGTMKVTEQIDALQSMSINPLRYLIAPRFLSGTIMLPLLTVFSIVMGIFGGYLLAVYFFKMSPVNYFDPMQHYTSPFDCIVGLIKSVVFGVLIVTICCFKGLKTQGGAAGVGRSTTTSVVICYTCILISNFLITMGLNVLKSEINRWLA